MTAVLTNHSKDRMKERCGLTKKSLQRMAEKALKDGIWQNQTTGALYRYIDSLWYFNKTADNIRLYGDHVFIFHKGVLITVLDLPNRFKGGKYVKRGG